VVDERGFAMLGAQVQAFRQVIIEGRRQFQQSGGAAADETGEIRVAGLAAGRYYLGFLEGSATVNSSQVRASAVVTTSGGDVDGIVFTPLSEPALSGTLRVEGAVQSPRSH